MYLGSSHHGPGSLTVSIVHTDGPGGSHAPTAPTLALALTTPRVPQRSVTPALQAICICICTFASPVSLSCPLALTTTTSHNLLPPLPLPFPFPLPLPLPLPLPPTSVSPYNPLLCTSMSLPSL